jgi:thiamine pyrophosphokinase
MNDILVLANGALPDRKTLSFLCMNKDLIVCCDGSFDRLPKAVTPDIVIGDLDSISQAGKKKLTRDAYKTLKTRNANTAHPVRTTRLINIRSQNDTDLEKAFTWLGKKGLLQAGDNRITVAGATGFRSDFSLYNLHLLVRFRHVNLILADPEFTVFLSSRIQIMDGLRKGQLISLLPLTRVRDVTTTGLKYQVKGRDLVPGRFESISNRTTGSKVTVTHRGGDLAVFTGI